MALLSFLHSTNQTSTISQSEVKQQCLHLWHIKHTTTCNVLSRNIPSSHAKLLTTRMSAIRTLHIPSPLNACPKTVPRPFAKMIVHGRLVKEIARTEKQPFIALTFVITRKTVYSITQKVSYILRNLVSEIHDVAIAGNMIIPVVTPALQSAASVTHQFLGNGSHVLVALNFIHCLPLLERFSSTSLCPILQYIIRNFLYTYWWILLLDTLRSRECCACTQ